MSKFRSKCGHILVSRTGDELFEKYLLSNADVDQIGDMLDDFPVGYIREERVVDPKSKYILPDDFDKIFSYIIDNSRSVLQCPECGRVYVDEKNDNHYVIYKPESWED